MLLCLQLGVRISVLVPLLKHLPPLRASRQLSGAVRRCGPSGLGAWLLGIGWVLVDHMRGRRLLRDVLLRMRATLVAILSDTNLR